MTQRIPWNVIPLDVWPTADQTAWAAAHARKSFLSDRRSLADYPPEQISQLRAAWGRWLGYLMCQDIAIGESGADALTHEAIHTFVETMFEHLSPVTVRTYVTSMLGVAEHLHPNSLSALKPIVRAVQKRISCIGEQAPERFDTVTMIKLGNKIMDEAGKMTNAFDAAALYRDGLAIKMLARAPFRISNFASIRLGQELLLIGDHYQIHIPAGKAKARQPISYPLPASLSADIERYLTTHRPRLLECRGRHWRADEDGFWISRDGAPFSAKALSHRIAELTEKRLGDRVSAHRFRSIAVTSISILAPDNVNISMGVLGHSTLAMSSRHYNRAGSADAARRYQDVINKLIGD